MTLSSRSLAFAAGAAALICVAFASPASASPPSSGLYVTMAARECPSYADIRANRARNNIQESLRDLGADTPYAAGQAISPDLEALTQPNCDPITGWQFTLGTGYRSRAVTGPWGALSIVTSPFARTIVTKASVPLLDTGANPTGRSLAGAVTFELTDQEAKLAARNALWAQGGTPSDPILNVPFPDEYGFGALRCAIDNLNGDNVEWIGVPNGARHVFCYAYYVKPPPTSGTIIVRKEVRGGEGLPSETFNFTGNVSFNPGGAFSLNVQNAAPAEIKFFRAEVAPGGTPWSFRELDSPNFKLASLACTSATHDSQITTSLQTGQADVTLAGGDTVRCTYVNDWVDPTGGLEIRKASFGGTGTFRYAVDPLAPNGEDTRHATAVTEEEGQPVTAAPSLGRLKAGSYRIHEQSPVSAYGRWHIDSVECDGLNMPVAGDGGVDVQVKSGQGVACTFTNSFIPKGSIVLRKTTLGAAGTAGFVITPAGEEGVSFRQSASTSEAGATATASGDDLEDLPLGSYVIQETTPVSAAGSWNLMVIRCDGQDMAADQGQITVNLTRWHPRADCTFTNQYADTPIPPIPPNPKPGPDPVTPEAKVTVTKQASRTQITLGQTITYRITARNQGPDPAADVIVNEQLQTSGKLLSVSPSQGHCVLKPVPTCLLGSVFAGKSAAIIAVVKPLKAGSYPNRVVVSTDTVTPTKSGSSSTARVQVKPKVKPSPNFTG